MNKFCHLHAHDEYSLLDGLGIVAENVKIAKELGFTAMAQTNHGSIAGATKFKKACDENNIKPIFGVELYFVDDLSIREKGEKRRHLTILIKNEEGFKNVNKILTKASLEGFYYKPRADKSLILDHLEGLIILSGCASGPLSEVNDLEFIFNLYESLGDDLYLEIMPLSFDKQYVINEAALELNQMLNVPLVATNDVHYPRAEDSKLHEVLLAMQSGARWNDKKRWKYSINTLYQQTYEEMLVSFQSMKQNPFSLSELEGALQQTMEIADKCEFDLPSLEPRLPSAPIILKTDKSPADILRGLCESAYKERFAEDDIDGIYRDRMEYELETLINQKFEKYFLMVHDLVSWCRGKDITIGPGRGSVGGSLVANLLGITSPQVDPIKYGLIFERFISPDRIDLPDIDIDFDANRRDEVIEYLKETYGHDCVAQVSTFGHLGGRSALRDVARVFEVPYNDVDKAAKTIPEKGFTLAEALEKYDELKSFKREYPEVMKFAIRLEGQVRHAGKHAAGIVISSHSFDEGDMGHLTVQGKGGETIVWDMRDLEHFGLIKLDVLGLTNLSVLNRCRKLVKQNHGVDIDYEALTFDDPKVLEEFNKGNTSCVFQFGTYGVKEFTPKIGVTCFDDLFYINTLYRPGPLRGGVSEEFRRRKHGESDVKYIHHLMEGITGETQGLIIFQEQIMNAVRQLAGFTWAESEKVRKVIGKSMGKAAFRKFESQFIDGCEKQGTLVKAKAVELFEQLKQFGLYGFNKSHAVEYSMIGYYDMWCKVYYPEEYLAAMLTMDKDRDKIAEYIKEARRLGIRTTIPSINKSDARDWEISHDDGGTILVCPLIEIKGIGEKTADELNRAKKEKGPFKTLSGLLDSVNKRVVNKRATGVLTAVGAFDELSDVEAEDREESSKEFLPWDIISSMFMYDSLLGRISETCDIVSVSEVQNTHEGELVFVAGHIIDFEVDPIAHGIISDESGNAAIKFALEVIKRHRITNGDLREKFVLIEGTKINSDFAVTRLWLLDDLLDGNFGPEKKLPMLENVSPIDCVVAKGIKLCDACHLSKRCRAPVPYTPGELPIMFVGEAPGQDEDKEGRGFVGLAGHELFGAVDLPREFFHVTNVVHCRPTDNRTPTYREIKHCSDLWLKLEIQETKPLIIFALGRSALYFFTGKNRGITSLNATVEWNTQYNAWIVYGIHPASILYNRDNVWLVESACDRLKKLIFSCLY